MSKVSISESVEMLSSALVQSWLTLLQPRMPCSTYPNPLASTKASYEGMSNQVMSNQVKGIHDLTIVKA